MRKITTTNIWHSDTRMSQYYDDEPLTFTRAENDTLYTKDGKSYIDAISSWWCVNLGHSQPKIIDAIKEQAGKLQHNILGGACNDKALKLANKLTELTDGHLSHAFFGSDGASAVEAALRVALEYRHYTGSPQKSKFIYLTSAYHGDSLGSVSVGFLQSFHNRIADAVVKHFSATAPHCANCPLGLSRLACDAECFEHGENSLKNMLENNADVVTALIVEPLVQGAGGIRIYSPKFLEKARKLCTKLDILLIFDEVAVAFYRTGTQFAYQQLQDENAKPDILVLGKGITNGTLPLSVALFTDKVFYAFVDNILWHSYTFGGNPIASAAALAAIELYETLGAAKLVANVGIKLQGKLLTLTNKLKNTKVFKNKPIYSDTIGFIGMIEFGGSDEDKKFASEILSKLMKYMISNGVFIRTHTNVLYFWMPYTITEENFERIFELIDKFIDKSIDV